MPLDRITFQECNNFNSSIFEGLSKVNAKEIIFDPIQTDPLFMEDPNYQKIIEKIPKKEEEEESLEENKEN